MPREKIDTNCGIRYRNSSDYIWKGLLVDSTGIRNDQPERNTSHLEEPGAKRLHNVDYGFLSPPIEESGSVSPMLPIQPFIHNPSPTSNTPCSCISKRSYISRLVWQARLQREDVEKLSFTSPFGAMCGALLFAARCFKEAEECNEKTLWMLCSKNPSAFLLMRNEREGRLTATRDIPPSSIEKQRPLVRVTMML